MSAAVVEEWEVAGASAEGASAEAALCIGDAAPSAVAGGPVGDGGPAGDAGPAGSGTEAAGTAVTGDGADVAACGVRDSMADIGVAIGEGAAQSAIVGPTTGAVFRFTAIEFASCKRRCT
jgi:hypothetical protein